MWEASVLVSRSACITAHFAPLHCLVQLPMAASAPVRVIHAGAQQLELVVGKHAVLHLLQGLQERKHSLLSAIIHFSCRFATRSTGRAAPMDWLAKHALQQQGAALRWGSSCRT